MINDKANPDLRKKPAQRNSTDVDNVFQDMLLDEEFLGIVRGRWFTSQLQELLGKSHGLEVTNLC